MVRKQSWTHSGQPALTLEELLAGVLLEESFVADGAVEVVDHQMEDGLDFFLVVSRVVGEGGVLKISHVRW